MNDSTECRVSIIGAGNMAREHIRAFQAVPGVTIAGIHSRTRKRAELLAKEFHILEVADSVPELYQRTNADLAIVAVDETSVLCVAESCMAFPWCLLLEKPPGLNVEEAEVIHQCAEGKNRGVVVAFNRRFVSNTITAGQDLATRDEKRFIHVQDQEDSSVAFALGRSQAVADNWMYANSIHLIDYLSVFGRGDVVSVERVVPWEDGKANVVVANVEFDSGDVGIYQGIWKGPGPWAVSISTPSKRWEFRPLEQGAFQVAGSRATTVLDPDPLDEEFKPGLRRQAEAAVAFALGRPSDAVRLGDALKTMRLVGEIFA